MDIVIYIAVYSAAYLLGSIPSAVWIGKWLHGSDIREHGSGNAGAVNSVRTYGWKTGLLVLLLDVAKGMLSVSLPLIFKLAAPGSEQMTNLQVLTGSMAILGHLFPVFADFRGGKGVATIFGIVLFMQPEIALICAVVFLVTILISGIASVSSLIAVTFFPILVIFVYKTPVKSMIIFSICVAVLLFLTHRANIKRLIKGEEKRLFSLFGKK